MAELNEVYRLARYYDVAFGRSIDREIAFLRELHQRQTGRPLGSFLDLACGPGYHAIEMARVGVQAAGMDLRPEMVDFARDKAKAEGVAVDWFVGDIRDFRVAQPVDMVFMAYDSLDCLLTNDQIVDHFKTVAANLKPGGLYVFEMSHPRDCSPYGYGKHRYAGKRDGLEVAIEWIEAEPDLATQITKVKTKVTVHENGAEQVYYDQAQERFCSAQEYRLLVERSGALDVLDFYGDFKFGQKLDNSAASRRLIGVLVKPQRGGR